MKARRILACVILVLFVLVVLFSHAFIIAEAHHECSGEDCAVCHVIASAESTVRNIGIALCSSAVFAALVTIAKAVKNERSQTFSASTPVSLKVKLSN